MDVFQEIWSERPHKCEICGDPIKGEPLAGNLFHVLPKGTYRRFIAEKRNLLLACWNLAGTGCHNIWHNIPREELIVDPRWKRIFDLYDELKREYNNAT